ncbi:hypothetical protein BU25DRAFT_487642, partial [Macroventuria anomochaeta]
MRAGELDWAGYAAIERLVTRLALAKMGRKINLERTVLTESIVSPDMLAEAFEALIGAIYVDSRDNLGTVQDVLKTVGFKTVASSLVSPLARDSHSMTATKVGTQSGSTADNKVQSAENVGLKSQSEP